MEQYDAIVIGGGIAGFEATLALKNFRRNVLWLGAEKFGEKLTKAEEVRNFPSFSGRGAELAALLEAQSAREALPFHAARADGVYAAGGGFLVSAGGEMFPSRTVVLATGVERKGSLKGEREFLGRGVSYCAVCDGALYKGKRIAAVLSSKAFAEEAEYLAGFAQHVYVYCPDGVRFRAENIEVREETPLGIAGRERVEELRFAGGGLPVDGVFLLRNSAPPAALVGGIGTTPDGHVRVARDMSTNLKGLFAAGDVTGRPYQYVKAAGEGLVAAYSVHEFLSAKKELP